MGDTRPLWMVHASILILNIYGSLGLFIIPVLQVRKLDIPPDTVQADGVSPQVSQGHESVEYGHESYGTRKEE